MKHYASYVHFWGLIELVERSCDDVMILSLCDFAVKGSKETGGATHRLMSAGSGGGLDALQFRHFLGQHPKRLVEFDILIDAIDGTG